MPQNPGTPPPGYQPQGYPQQPGYPPQGHPQQPGYAPQGFAQPGMQPPPKKKTSPALLVGLLGCGGLFVLVIILGAIGAIAGGGSKTETGSVVTTTTTAIPVASTPAEGAPTTVASADEVPITTAPPTTPAIAENVIGTPVDEDGVIFTVTSVSDPAQPDQFTTIDPGERLVSLEITAQNTKGENETVSSLMCFSLKADDGTAGEISILGAQGASRGLDGSLLPGESLKGSLAFTIPANAKGLYLKINCGLTGGSLIQLRA